MHERENICLLFCVRKASMAVTTRAPAYRCGDVVGTHITIKVKDAGYINFV
jgi:hypothetical protein